MEQDAKKFYNAALAAERAGKPAEALKLYRAAARADLNFRPAFINLGAFYARRGRPDLSTPFFQRALELGEDDAVYFNLGAELYKLERLEESAAHLKKCLRLNTRFIKAHILLAYVYSRLKDQARAEIYFQNALKIEPGNRMAGLGFAVMLADAGAFERSLGVVESCLARAPADESLQNLRAGLLMKLNRYDESLIEYRRLAHEAEGFTGFTGFLEKARSAGDNDLDAALAGSGARIKERTARLRARIEMRKQRLGRPAAENPSPERHGIEGALDVQEELQEDLRDLVDLSFLHLFQGDPDRALQYLVQARKLKHARDKNAPAG